MGGSEKERGWKEGKREGKYQLSYQGVIIVPGGERKRKRETDLGKKNLKKWQNFSKFNKHYKFTDPGNSVNPK